MADDSITIAGFIYRVFVLAVLFVGGYALMRYGMAIDKDVAFYVAVIGMPLVTLILWFISYRGKKFK